MNIYQRILEGLSGASRAYMRMGRENRKLSTDLQKGNGDSESRNKSYIKMGKNEKKSANLVKAIPQKKVRKKYRATRQYDLDKSNAKALRFFRKDGI